MSTRWDQVLIDSLPAVCNDDDVIKVVRKAKADGVREAGRQMTQAGTLGFADQVMLKRMADQIEQGEL